VRHGAGRIRERGVTVALTYAFGLVMLVFMPKSPGWIGPVLARGRLGQAHETGPSGAFG
jgi:hypothetical protein